jgi:aspartate aminotransferase-like enzyme
LPFFSAQAKTHRATTGRAVKSRVSSGACAQKNCLIIYLAMEQPMNERLMTPGPTHIPERVFHAMQQPAMHHRTGEFKAIFLSCCQKLQTLLDSETLPVLLACSGSGAMEAALLNACLAGQKIIVVNAGKFGDRWSRIAERLDLAIVEITAPWGESFSEEQLVDVVKNNSDAAAFCMQQSETSTTVQHPVEMVTKVLKTHAPDTLLIVDAISSAATCKISARELGIDLLILGSQKALMLPPGLAGIAASKRAWNVIESRNEQALVPSLYFDLLTERKSQEKGVSAWTPAMNIILGLQEVLTMLEEEGHEHVYRRHQIASNACRAALTELGFTLLAESNPAPGVTGGFPPEGIDSEKLRSTLLSQSGIRIAGGQDQFKGKIVRIGHMGTFGPGDILNTVAFIEIALMACGGKNPEGRGVRKALNVYSENQR